MAHNGKLLMETAPDWYKACGDTDISWGGGGEEFYLYDGVEVRKQPRPQPAVQSDNKSSVTKVCPF